MAKKKPVRKPVTDPALLMTGLSGFDELTRLIRQLAVDSESSAGRGMHNAYDDLRDLLREVRMLADSGRSALMADVSNPTAENLSENCRIALTLENYKDLHSQCGTCIKKITGWQPAPWVENTRPPLLIGTVEGVREKKVRLAKEYFDDPDRVADREGQKAIRSAVNRVLESLNATSSSLRMKLVSQGAGGHSEGKRWVQKDLDEAIKKYRTDNLMGFLEMKKAIADNEPNAINRARKLFGRNSISRILRASPAMVSKSPEWQSLATELGIQRGPVSKRKLLPSQRDHAADGSDETFTEMQQKARENLSEEEMDHIRQQLQDGTMSQAEAFARIDSLKR